MSMTPLCDFVASVRIEEETLNRTATPDGFKKGVMVSFDNEQINWTN